MGLSAQPSFLSSELRHGFAVNSCFFSPETFALVLAVARRRIPGDERCGTANREAEFQIGFVVGPTGWLGRKLLRTTVVQSVGEHLATGQDLCRRCWFLASVRIVDYPPEIRRSDLFKRTFMKACWVCWSPRCWLVRSSIASTYLIGGEQAGRCF